MFLHKKKKLQNVRKSRALPICFFVFFYYWQLFAIVLMVVIQEL